MNRPDITNAWLYAYCRWFDADRADHHRTARAWGLVADHIVRAGDRLRLWGKA